ncbi:glycosyl transferase family 17 protein [Aspergillus homomorphus CBS 101889]|uniref:Glycosyl transferase family 17 protein n=1 Tax=Aspergillus homomorphus (strain CBS 101889) TaxID=1450537 RepID=A0A395HK43_ASPHC|nr:glycosyl transferase family 17 protein [Aspergillus homomorphus CBS 101889]RAL07889.1 glycosyl transferase family 17 protein [Aspergillus homomorphus CBS 101889]
MQQLCLLSVLLIALCFLPRPYLPTPSSHLAPHAYTAPARKAEDALHGFLPEDEAQALCAEHDLEPYGERSQRRKVYDLIPISTELDWLEIRMHELDSEVDYFVIVESSETFTGQGKPLHFAEHFGDFSRFADKILYRAVDLGHLRDNSTWERESWIRNALLTEVFPSLLGRAAPARDDVLVVSDTDEIPRARTLALLRNCAIPTRVTLRSRFYYYSFQWHHLGRDWHHPQATVYAGPDHTILPQDLRMGSAGARDIWNASWHCSSCFASVAQLVHKIQAFSHTEYNRPEFVDPREIVRRVRNGLDLFDRDSEKYEKVTPVTDVPGYLKANADRFAFLLDRDPASANFVDY